MTKFKIKFSSTRIFITTIVLFLPFIPVALANIGQPPHDPTTTEIVENIYSCIIFFPFGYIIDFINSISNSHIPVIVALLAIIADSYIDAVILNTVFDFLRQKQKRKINN